MTATWDADAAVWVAVSDDIALVTEAPTIEALLAKLPGMIQDLLEDDGGGIEQDIPFELIARHQQNVRARVS